MTDEKLCVCGCKLFNDFRPFTISDVNFGIWTMKENIKALTLTIPIVQCVACGRLIAPQVSFAGKNILDAEVKLYSELLNYMKSRNARIDQLDMLSTEMKSLIWKLESEKQKEVVNVPVSPSVSSEESTENVVPDVKGGSGPKRNNKK